MVSFKSEAICLLPLLAAPVRADVDHAGRRHDWLILVGFKEVGADLRMLACRGRAAVRLREAGMRC